MLAVSGWRELGQVAAGKQQRHARVAEAERRQTRELPAELQRQLATVHQGVDLGHGLQVVVLEAGIGDRAEGLGERLDVLRLDRQACRGRVPTPALEVAGAVAQAVVQVERGDRAARALPVAFGAGDQHHRPLVALDQP